MAVYGLMDIKSNAIWPGAVSERFSGFTAFKIAIGILAIVLNPRITKTPAFFPRTIWLRRKLWVKPTSWSWLRVGVFIVLIWFLVCFVGELFPFDVQTLFPL